MMSESNYTNLKQLLADHPVLLEQVKSDDSAFKERLFQEVDESNFSLADWLDSLSVLYQWLDQNGLNLSCQDGLGYISCAAKSVGSSSTLIHLSSLVHDFLDQYGCELAVKK
jgi:hypothetical protein